MNDAFQQCLQRIQSVPVQVPKQLWQQVVKELVDNGYSFRKCQQLWQAVFRDWPADGAPVPMWCPADRDIVASNIHHFCQQYQLQDYADLHRWSITNRADFWQAAIDQLEIEFAARPSQILDQAEDVKKASWLPGAKLNIVQSCLPMSGPLSSEDEELDAIVWSDQDGVLHHWSRRQLADRVMRIAAALRHAGLSGQPIAVVTPMTAWSVAFYLGVIYSGGTIVSIADSFSAPEIRRRLDIVKCRTVFTYDQMQRAGRGIGLLDRVHQASDLGAPLRSLVLRACDEETPLTKADGLRDDDASLMQWIEEVEADYLSQEADICNADQAINILFSSGTTGDPKAIVWDHRTPLKCAADGWFHQDIHPGDVVAWPTNLGWMMGPWLIFASLINRAAMALYHDAPTGVGFGLFVQNSGVTMLGVVPSMVKNWRATDEMEGLDWSQIRCFSSTGESSNSEDYFYLSYLAGFRPVIEYCGGTEIGGGYITSTVTCCNAPATFTTPAIGLDFCILDAEGKQAEEGELFLVPPSIGLSSRLLNRDHDDTYYSGVPKIAGKTLRRHGDHFQVLPGGYFAAGGRADDTMNLGGIKVSSVEIEKSINQLPGVIESAAVARPESNGGPSQLVLFLVLESPVSESPALESPAGGMAVADAVDPMQKRPHFDAEDWRQRCNQILKQELNPLFRVAEVRQIDKMPRTASNKLMRRLLRDQLEGPTQQ